MMQALQRWGTRGVTIFITTISVLMLVGITCPVGLWAGWDPRAMRDALTGVPNRRWIMDRFQAAGTPSNANRAAVGLLVD